jgi:hypothetical protein
MTEKGSRLYNATSFFSLSSAQRVFERRHWSPGLCQHSIYTTGFQCRVPRSATQGNHYIQLRCALERRTGLLSKSVSPALHAAFKRVFERRHWSPGFGTHERYKTGFQCRVPRRDSEGCALERQRGTCVTKSALKIGHSSAQRVFERRHWSPGFGTHERYKTGFQCLRFRKLRTGKTDVRPQIGHSSAQRVFEQRHWSPSVCRTTEERPGWIPGSLTLPE